MIKLSYKVVITGTGSQAPYGIGEIIDILPAAHFRKIEKFVRQWYNAPSLHCKECGAKLELDYEPWTNKLLGLAEWDTCGRLHICKGVRL